MTKAYWWLITLILIFSGCASGPKRVELEGGQRYTISEYEKDVFSLIAPEGRWVAYPRMNTGLLRLFGTGGRGYQGVGYETRVSITNLNSYKEKVKVFDLEAKDRTYKNGNGTIANIADLIEAMETGNFQVPIDRRMKMRYTPFNMGQSGQSGVEGSIRQLAGLTCVRFNENQNNMSGINVISSFSRCPLFINGEYFSFVVTLQITYIAPQLTAIYGDNTPSKKELMDHYEALLAPMYDSIEILNNPTQTVPENYFE